MAVNGSVSEDGVDQAEDSPEEDVDDTDQGPVSREASPPKGGRRRAPLIAIGVAVLAAVAIIAVVLSSGGSKAKSKTTSTTVAPAAGFTTFRDTVAGFTLSYPTAWTSTKSNDNDVPLQLTIGSNPLDTVLVRVVGIPATVDVSNVDNIKAFTDAVISGSKITVLKQQSLTVNGLPAYYYFYTLPADPATGTTLVHSHFFLFPPQQMVSVTFQTLNADFAALAPTFDQVVSSLRTIPTGTSATSTP